MRIKRRQTHISHLIPCKENIEQGFIMVVGMIVLTSLLLLALPFIYQIMSEQKLSEKSYKFIAAMSLAEAGVERAIWEFNSGDISTWDGDSSLRTKTISSFQAAGGNVIGDIDINVHDPEGENPVLESTGSVAFSGSHTVDKTIRVVLERDDSPLFDYGTFGENGVLIKPETLVDSYDSRAGLYGGDNVHSFGHVGTNDTSYGCIDLKQNVGVYGNAVSGPESEPEQVIVVEEGAHIYGEKAALSEDKDFPSLSPPEGLPYRGSFDYHNLTLFISQSGRYSSISITGSKGKLEITADVTLYITGTFYIGNGSELQVNEGVCATIYLGGTFEAGQNSKINQKYKDPTKLIILGTDSFTDDTDIEQGSQFYGAFYSPRAKVIVGQDISFYGSIVAKEVEVKNDTQFHYDEALSTIVIGGDSGSYSVKSWQEKITR